MAGTFDFERGAPGEGSPRAPSPQDWVPPSPSSWEELAPGDAFRLVSTSGNEYRLNLVARVGEFAYTRRSDNKLARIERHRVAELHRVGRSSVLVAGDRLRARRSGSGEEVEGHLLTGPGGFKGLNPRSGPLVPWEDLDLSTLLLCFRAPSCKVGEEITVRSKLGTVNRGWVEAAQESLLAVRIDGVVRNLRPYQLDLSSLFVLVPLDATRLGGEAHSQSTLSRPLL